jgi:nucleotide-binding universal stress UspA family protein
MNVSDARRRVVVGVDGSQDALRAVRWAAREAARRDAALHLVAAILWSDDRLPGIPAIGQDRTGDALRHLAKTALDEAAAAAAEAAPGIVTVRREIVGFAPPVLRDAAKGAEMLVVGDRGRGRIASVLAGSVAVAVAAHASGPVVIVRGDEAAEDSAGPVVVGIDGTPRSEAALAFAFEEASAQDAPLLAVHTWSDFVNDPYMAPLIDWDAVAEDEARLLAERLAGWEEKYPDVAVESFVARGRASHVLLDRSHGARLVVVGSRGHGEVAGLLLDSVSNALVHGAACPVAVVRSADED